MNAVVFKISLPLIACYLSSLVNFCLAGTCWSTMIKNSNSRCTELLYERISKEDCCASSTSTMTAWSADELDPSTLFFWRMLGGGVPCVPCKESCKSLECQNDKTCVIRKGVPKCVCPSTCKDYKKKPKGPLCGTDGRTYKNWCRMRKKSCKQKAKNLSIAYYGTCQNSCDHISCSDGKSCLLDQNLTPHCVHCSKKKCPAAAKHRQVCGSDGVTYKSACHLKDVACHAGKAIPLAYKGPCKENVTCAHIRCHDQQQCLTDKEAGGKPRCVACNSPCRPKHFQGPICGSNNSTYATWCHMMQDACVKGFVIATRHSGKCNSNNNNNNMVLSKWP